MSYAVVLEAEIRRYLGTAAVGRGWPVACFALRRKRTCDPCPTCRLADVVGVRPRNRREAVRVAKALIVATSSTTTTTPT